MNKLKSTIRKSIIAGVTMSTILGMSNAQFAYASVQPADLTYYTTNADGTITANTADDSKKEISELDVSSTTANKVVNAVKANNNTIKVYLATAGELNATSDLSGITTSSSSNVAKSIGLEATNGGKIDLYGSGTMNIYSAHGSGAGASDKPAALAYAFWNSTGDNNAIVAHGDNMVINAEIKGSDAASKGARELAILKNTATNSSITIGNGYKVNGKITEGTDLKNTRIFFANNDSNSGGTSSNTGGSTITIGNDTEINFDVRSTSALGEAYIAYNGTDNIATNGNNKIVFGDSSKIKINVDGYNPVSALAMNYLTRTGATAQIEFGNNTTVMINNTVAAAHSYIYGASNYSSKGASITFGNNTNLEFSSKRTGSTGNYTTSIYGVHDWGSTGGKITFGDNTNFTLYGEDKNTIINGVYHVSSTGAIATFGNNTTMNLAAKAVDNGNAIDVVGIWQETNSGSIVEFGNNTTINSKVEGTTEFGSALAAYLDETTDSVLKFGNNTIIDSKYDAIGGLAGGIYLSSSKKATVEFGSGTKITAHAKASGTTEAVMATGIYITGTAAKPTENSVIQLNGDTYISVVADKLAGAYSYAYAIYDGGCSNTNNTYVNIDNINSPDMAAGTGKVQITGDIVAYEGNIHIGLNGESSYLNGEIYQASVDDPSVDGKVVLYMDNGAKWNLKANSFNADGTPSTLNSSLISFDTLNVGSNCTIDLTADGTMREFVAADNNNYRTLRSSNGNFKVRGTGNTFVINTDVANNISDTIVLDSTAAGENYIKINYDPALAAGRELNDLGKAKVVEQAAGGNFDGTFKVKATVGGLHKYLPIIYREGDNSWYVKGFTESGPTNTVQLVGKVLENNMALAMQKTLNSDLSRRMGEIRDNPDNAGAWVKISAGENTIGGNSGQKYSSIQGGIDKHIQSKRGSHFVGLAFEHTTTSNSYDIESAGGRGNANMFTLYNTWAGNDGHYYDIVAKTGKLDNRADLLDENFKNANLSYANWMTGVSFEYGVRKQLTGGAYWQPELQLAYSRINGTNYSSTNGVNVSQDAANSLIARLGITLGKKVDKNSNVYITASVLKEFLGKTTTHLTSGADKMSLDTDMSSFWGEIVIGANTKLNSKTDMYVQAATNIGGKVRTKWQAQAGFRWNW